MTSSSSSSSSNNNNDKVGDVTYGAQVVADNLLAAFMVLMWFSKG
jgi:hypothetical protein